MVRPLVSPEGLNRLPHIHHPQFSIISSIAGYILVHHTQGLGLLAERARSNRSIGAGVCEGETGSIGQREEVLAHAFDTVYVTALETFRYDLFGRQIVCDQSVVAACNELYTFLHDINAHDLSALAEDCLFLEEQSDDIISDQILTDLEEFYLEISPQSDNSEPSRATPIFQQVENVPFMQFLRHLEGVFGGEGAQGGIPETHTSLEIPHEEVLVYNGEAICPFGEYCAHDLKFLIETVDLYLPLSGLPPLALQEVTAADKLFFIEDGYSFDFYRRIFVGKMEIRCQFSRVEWPRLDCFWLQGGLEVDLTSLFLLAEARDLISGPFVQPHDSILHFTQLTLMSLQQFLHHRLASSCLELLGPALGRIDEGSVLGNILNHIFEVFPGGDLEGIGGV